MRITHTTTYLNTIHIVRMIFLIVGYLWAYRARETWPTTGRIKLVLGRKEWLTSRHININPRLKLIPKRTRKGPFCSILLSHSVGFWTQTFLKLLLIWLVISTSINDRTSCLIDIDMTVAIRIFLEIILMIILSRNKVLEGQQFNRQRLTVLLSHFLENLLDNR